MLPGKWIDANTNDIDECMEVLVRGMTATMELSRSLLYPGFAPETFGIEKGRKYARVWHDNGTQRFVCFFVQLDNGDVWKADGWKKPALNFTRGNIMTVRGRHAITLGKIHPETGYYYPAF